MSKSFVIMSISIFAFGLLAIANLQTANAGNVIQQETPPAPQEAAPAATPTQEVASPSDVPVLADSVLQDPVQVPTGDLIPTLMAPSAVPVAACDTCCCTCCVCPVPTTICLVEPECGCSYEVCLQLPPCCVGEAPQVSWRNGILGRKIAKLCWPCCNKRAKVVIPVFGGPRVFE